MARSKKAETDEDIVNEAQERFDYAQAYQSTANRHYVADMKFANGDDDNMAQWDDTVSGGRKSSGRPALTVNKTRVHCLQIINDARQNPVQIRINPVGDDATYEASQIYEGIIRHIEYISNAQQAYANATYCQVMGGIGYWRVLVDYAHDNTFDQEIYIKRIADPTSVYLDPDIQQSDGSDAKWGFLFYETTRDEFEAEYGTSDDPDDANLNNAALTLNSPRSGKAGGYTDDKHVQMVEYYRVGEKHDKLVQLPVRALEMFPPDVAMRLAQGMDPDKGPIVRVSSMPDGLLDQLAQLGIFPVSERDVAEPDVEWFLIADNKIIERKDWPGMYVPIVRVPCEEIIINGQLDWVSHVRHLRDPQRLYNWYTSQAAEFVALQTKSPFVGVAESIEPYLQDWENANVENKSVLLYKGRDTEGNEIPRPERATPPVMAAAYMEGLKISQAEMMMATGQYQAVMGEPGNETSGVAINARQRQGDNATYHVIDRLASAIRYTGRIILDLIPKVYDSKRALMIFGEDGTQTQVHIDPDAPQAHQTTLDPNQPPAQPPMNREQDPDTARQEAMRTVFNPKIGRYSVVADVGPSFATKRQEAFNAFSQVIAQNGAAFQVIGDFWAKNADFPGADEMANRLKQGLPPQYKSGGPDPQVQMITAEAQKVQQQASDLLGQADKEIADLKTQNQQLQMQLKDKSGDLMIKDYSAETDRLKAVGTIDPMSLQIVVRQLVEDMLDTKLETALYRHADVQGAVQQRMAPLQPEEGAAASATAPGPGNGQMVQ
jgi:hypothetical protein